MRGTRIAVSMLDTGTETTFTIWRLDAEASTAALIDIASHISIGDFVGYTNIGYFVDSDAQPLRDALDLRGIRLSRSHTHEPGTGTFVVVAVSP